MSVIKRITNFLWRIIQWLFRPPKPPEVLPQKPPVKEPEEPPEPEEPAEPEPDCSLRNHKRRRKYE